MAGYRSVLCLGLCLLAGLSPAQSPYPNVRIDAQESDWFAYPPCEPSIAVDPTNPLRMVAGAILDATYVSADGGKTWSESSLASPLGVFGDPCVIAGPKGDFYYFHLGDPGGQGWGGDRLLECIVVQRSKDGGRTWSKGAAIGSNAPKDQDKEWAVAAPDGKRVYTTWTQFDKYESKVPTDSTNILFSASNRRAKRWSRPVRINARAGNCADDDGTVEGAVPACGRNGEVYVAWALEETIWFDRSMDGGRTWLAQDIAAAQIVGGWNQEIPGIMRCNGMPVLLSDVSDGPRGGALYLCWADTRNGADDTDIFFASSTDGGTTWTAAVRVNQDAPGRQQFFPWMAIDRATGALYVVYYDRRNYDDLRTDVYLASSTDGGLTWADERISDRPFAPSDQVFFGDYTNISAHDGVVRPIWTRGDGAQLSVWTALIKK